MPKKLTDNERKIKNILIKEYGPIKRIVLFGSRARGKSDEYSDWDLAIIKNTKKRFVERLGKLPPLPFKTDIFVYTPEEFATMQRNQNPFIMEMLKSGKVIYEASTN